jgi:hypothetical protein
MKRKKRTREDDDAVPVVRFAEDLRSVFDLEKAINAYGREIYVEEWEENSRRPRVWYEFNRQNVLIKYERRPAGVLTSNLGRTQYLPQH